MAICADKFIGSGFSQASMFSSRTGTIHGGRRNRGATSDMALWMRSEIVLKERFERIWPDCARQENTANVLHAGERLNQ